MPFEPPTIPRNRGYFFAQPSFTASWNDFVPGGSGGGGDDDFVTLDNFVISYGNNDDLGDTHCYILSKINGSTSIHQIDSISPTVGGCAEYIPQLDMWFVGLNKCSIAVSQDGISWEVKVLETDSTRQIQGVIYVDAWSKLFAFNSYGDVFSSTDGLEWTKIYNSAASDFIYFPGIVQDGSRLAACAGTVGTLYSDNGETFTLSTSSSSGTYAGLNTTTIMYKNKFITVFNKKVFSLATSPVNWSQYENKTFSDNPEGFARYTNGSTFPTLARYIESIDAVIGMTSNSTGVFVSAITDDLTTLTTKTLRLGGGTHAKEECAACYNKNIDKICIPSNAGVYVFSPQDLLDYVTSETVTADDLNAKKIAIPELESMTIRRVYMAVKG